MLYRTPTSSAFQLPGESSSPIIAVFSTQVSQIVLDSATVLFAEKHSGKLLRIRLNLTVGVDELSLETQICLSYRNGNEKDPVHGIEVYVTKASYHIIKYRRSDNAP